MTTRWKDAGVKMGRCALCDHDLITRSTGRVQCSNGHCKRFRTEAHPTGKDLNAGKATKA